MTITSETTRSTLYTANGITTQFSTGFKVLANPETGDAELTVYQLDGSTESVVDSADYSVTGVGDALGGTVVFDTAPTSGLKIRIKSNVSKTQDTDLTNQGAGFRESYEDMVDRAVRMIQEQQETIDRAVTVSITSESEGASLSPDDGKVIGWDGTTLTNLTPNSDTYISLSPFMETVLDDTTASEARTTLGLAIGTNVQAYDAELAALAGLTSAADRLPYFTGSGAAALATFTSFARTLVDDATAAAALTTLGITVGTWTPSPTSLTVSGTPTYTGEYIRIAGAGVFWWLSISATTSTSSTAGTTYFEGLSSVVAVGMTSGALCVDGASAGTVYSSGQLFTNGRLYPPTWSGRQTVMLSGFYPE